MAVDQAAIRLVEQFCAERATADIRLEIETRGSTMTIVERRPPWTGDGDWTSQPIAQLREARGEWSLYWPRHTGRWQPYEGAPATDVAGLLAEIEADHDGVFWG